MQGATMPILVISSDSGVSDAVLVAGADAFLLKPFRISALTQLLHVLLPTCGETRAVGE
jgi:DNA-binding response OmpR family regulator